MSDKSVFLGMFHKPVPKFLYIFMRYLLRGYKKTLIINLRGGINII